MAEQQSKPTTEEAGTNSEQAIFKKPFLSRRLIPLAIAIVLLIAGCWGSSGTPESEPEATRSTPTVIPTRQSSRPTQSNAALTRIAASLAQTEDEQPTATPTEPAADSALIPLPTVTPTIMPSPVATRTVELNGEATLRLQLANQNFESSGQPVVIALEPRSYVLGGETMTESDEWCSQLGPTGLIFDLTYTLHPSTENLHVGGELRLYDGFCGQWGSLGNLLSYVPVSINVPVGTTAIFEPALLVQGSFFGLPNVLEVTTGVYLDLSIRNPYPQ